MIRFWLFSLRRKTRPQRFAITCIAVILAISLIPGIQPRRTAQHTTARHLLETPSPGVPSPEDQCAEHEGQSGEISILVWADGNCCSRSMPDPVAGILWTIGMLYMFLAIAIVCDDYFVASLELISEALGLSDDVAGATFMAAGSSAPELFTSLVGVFTKPGTNVGAGTIVGSAAFNIAVICGASVIFAGNTLVLDWWPLARDGVYYSMAIIAVILVFLANSCRQIYWWQGLIFICFYAGYITLMVFNERLGNAIRGPLPNEGGDLAEEDETTEGSNKKEMKPVIEIEDANGNQLGASLLDNADSDPEGTPPKTRKRGNSTLTKMDENRPHMTPRKGDGDVTPRLGAGHLEPIGKEEIDEEQRGILHKILFVLSWPLLMLFKFTIVDCSNPQMKRYYVATFAACIFWIGAISFVMVDFALKLGLCLHWSPNIIGVTLLAVGTSVPDALSSILVARMGKGNMAVSNALGSNVFDIFLGLGFPWFLDGLIRQLPQNVSPDGITLYAMMLFALLFVFLVLCGAFKWNFHVWHGYVLIAVYLVYVTIAVLIDKKAIPTIVNSEGWTRDPTCPGMQNMPAAPSP